MRFGNLASSPSGRFVLAVGNLSSTSDLPLKTESNDPEWPFSMTQEDLSNDPDQPRRTSFCSYYCADRKLPSSLPLFGFRRNYRMISLHCIKMHFISMQLVALYSIALYCIAFYCVELNCIELQCILLHHSDTFVDVVHQYTPQEEKEVKYLNHIPQLF